MNDNITLKFNLTEKNYKTLQKELTWRKLYSHSIILYGPISVVLNIKK